MAGVVIYFFEDATPEELTRVKEALERAGFTTKRNDDSDGPVIEAEGPTFAQELEDEILKTESVCDIEAEP